LVFITEFGGPVDPRNLRAIEIAADKAGVENVGVHTLRHSAAVTWLEAGVRMKRETTGRGLRIHRVVLMASTLGKRLGVSRAGGSAVGYVGRLVDSARPSRRYVWQWWRR
jgi:integrase